MEASTTSALRGVLGVAPLAAMPVILWPGELHPLLSLTLIVIAVVGLIFIGLHFLPRRELKNRTRDPILETMNAQGQSAPFWRGMLRGAALILFFVAAWYVLDRLGYWNRWIGFVFYAAVVITLMEVPPRANRSERR